MSNLKLPPKLEFNCVTTSQEGSAIRNLARNAFDAWYERTFAGAVEVTSFNGDAWDESGRGQHTHRAILICAEPIERGVSLDEIVRALKHLDRSDVEYLQKLADRLEKEGIKP